MDNVLSESWFALTLAEQMVNIGNEVKRALRFDLDPAKRAFFLDKAIAYTELSMKDPKNQRVIPELAITKEVLTDYGGEHMLNCSKEEIYGYYDMFRYLIN